MMVDRGVFGSEGVSFEAAADFGGRLGGFLESRGKRVWGVWFGGFPGPEREMERKGSKG